MYNSACQLLNNLLETQDSQSETSRNPPGDALSTEENMYEGVCATRLNHGLRQNKRKKTNFPISMISTIESDRMEELHSLYKTKKDRSIISFYCV